MDAILSRAPNRQLEHAAANWLRATARLFRATARGAAYALEHYSRAAILLRGGKRPLRRL